MYIFEELRKEHDNLREFTNTLEALAITFMESNEISFGEFYNAIEYIKDYADKKHHQKEEEILFKGLLETGDELVNNIINHAMIVEHNLARMYVWELENAIRQYEEEASVKLKLSIITNTMSYVYLLRKHIDKENNVLYPYGEKLLSAEDIENMDIKAKEFDKSFN